MKRVIAVALIGAALAGCATAYQPSGFSGGYTELKLSEGSYRITVDGNGYTSTQRAENIALLRAAELTLRDGFDRFVVLGGRVAQENSGSTPVTVNRVGNTLIASGGDTITKPNGSIMIRMVSKADPSYASALDAALIQGQLRQQLGVKT